MTRVIFLHLTGSDEEDVADEEPAQSNLLKATGDLQLMLRNSGKSMDSTTEVY